MIGGPHTVIFSRIQHGRFEDREAYAREFRLARREIHPMSNMHCTLPRHHQCQTGFAAPWEVKQPTVGFARM